MVQVRERESARQPRPTGESSWRCKANLHALVDACGEGCAAWNRKWNPAPLYHQYSCTMVEVPGQNGAVHLEVKCGGQDRAGSTWRSPGKPSDDKFDPFSCKPIQPDNKCFEKCLQEEWAKPRPMYGIPFGMDCQEYDDDVNTKCRRQCLL